MDDEAGGEEPRAEQLGVSPQRAPKPKAQPLAVRKLDHREVFGTRSALADGLIDKASKGRAIKDPSKTWGMGKEGLDLDSESLGRAHRVKTTAPRTRAKEPLADKPKQVRNDLPPHTPGSQAEVEADIATKTSNTRTSQGTVSKKDLEAELRRLRDALENDDDPDSADDQPSGVKRGVVRDDISSSESGDDAARAGGAESDQESEDIPLPRSKQPKPQGARDSTSRILRKSLQLPKADGTPGAAAPDGFVSQHRALSPSESAVALTSGAATKASGAPQPSRDEKGRQSRGSGSDSESEMRPFSPPHQELTEEGETAEQATRSADNSEPESEPRPEMRSVLKRSDAEMGQLSRDDRMAARKHKFDRMPKYHQNGIEVQTNQAAIEHRRRMQELDAGDHSEPDVGMSEPSSRASTPAQATKRGHTFSPSESPLDVGETTTAQTPRQQNDRHTTAVGKEKEAHGGAIFCEQCGEPSASGTTHCSCGAALGEIGIRKQELPVHKGTAVKFNSSPSVREIPRSDDSESESDWTDPQGAQRAHTSSSADAESRAASSSQASHEADSASIPNIQNRGYAQNDAKRRFDVLNKPVGIFTRGQEDESRPSTVVTTTSAQSDSQATVDTEQKREQALEEADEFLNAFAPPRRLQKAAPAPAELPRQSEGEARTGMLDPFLKSLGMPQKIPEGTWGEGESPKAEQSGASQSVFQPVTDKLLTLKQNQVKAAASNQAHQSQKKQKAVDVSLAESAATVTTNVSMSSVLLDPSVIKALREIKALRDEGVLTDEEFVEQKKIILGGSAAASAPAMQLRAATSATELTQTAYFDDNVQRSPGSDDRRLSMTEKAQVLAGLGDDDDDESEAQGPFAAAAQRFKEYTHVKQDQQIGQEPVFMIRPPSTAASSENHPQTAVSTSSENTEKTESAAPPPRAMEQAAEPVARRRHRGAPKPSAALQQAQMLAIGDKDPDHDQPLFMKDHDDEVAKLRRQAEAELEAFEQADPEYDDFSALQYGVKHRGDPEPAEGTTTFSPEIKSELADDQVVTDNLIQEAWLVREARIEESMHQQDTTIDMLPADRGAVAAILAARQKASGLDSSDLPSTVEIDDADSRATSRYSQRPETQNVASKEVKRFPDQQVWEETAETETGWGSDASSDVDFVPNPADLVDPGEGLWTHESVIQIEREKHAAQELNNIVAQSQEPESTAPAAIASGADSIPEFEREAIRLETEARLLREAAEQAEQQRLLREKAEREALEAKEEAERLRKQLEAMDDRIKATKKLEERQKTALVENIILAMIEDAVDVSDLRQELSRQSQVQEKQNSSSERADPAKSDVQDGDDELRKWQQNMEKSYRVRKDIPEELSAPVHVPRPTDDDSNRPETAEIPSESSAAVSPPEAPLSKKIVDYVDPADITESDEDEDEDNDDDDEFDEHDLDEQDDLAALDPELLRKLQALSAVLIQRTFRNWRASPQFQALQEKRMQEHKSEDISHGPDDAPVESISPEDSTTHPSDSVHPEESACPLPQAREFRSPKEVIVVDLLAPREEEVTVDKSSEYQREPETGNNMPSVSEPAIEAEITIKPSTTKPGQGTASTFKAARALFRQRGFNNVAEVFVYFETGASKGDALTAREIERGIQSLKLDSSLNPSMLLSAFGRKGRDSIVSYKDFFRCLHWEDEGTGAPASSVQALEEARISWKKTAERVRRHVQISRETQEQMERLKQQEAARAQLHALRKEIGKPGIPFSARGPASARNTARARKPRGSTTARSSKATTAPSGKFVPVPVPISANTIHGTVVDGVQDDMSRQSGRSLELSSGNIPVNEDKSSEKVQGASIPMSGQDAALLIHRVGDAALLIQKVARGRQGRVRFRARCAELREFNAAAACIQRHWRKAMVRGRVPRVAAASNPSSPLTQKSSCASPNALRKEPEAGFCHDSLGGSPSQPPTRSGTAQSPRSRSDKAALVLQQFFRKVHARQLEFLEAQLLRQEQMMDAAIVIQAVGRGYISRKKTAKLQVYQERPVTHLSSVDNNGPVDPARGSCTDRPQECEITVDPVAAQATLGKPQDDADGDEQSAQEMPTEPPDQVIDRPAVETENLGGSVTSLSSRKSATVGSGMLSQPTGQPSTQNESPLSNQKQGLVTKETISLDLSKITGGRDDVQAKNKGTRAARYANIAPRQAVKPSRQLAGDAQRGKVVQQEQVKGTTHTASKVVGHSKGVGTKQNDRSMQSGKGAEADTGQVAPKQEGEREKPRMRQSSPKKIRGGALIADRTKARSTTKGINTQTLFLMDDNFQDVHNKWVLEALRESNERVDLEDSFSQDPTARTSEDSKGALSTRNVENGTEAEPGYRENSTATESHSNTVHSNKSKVKFHDETAVCSATAGKPNPLPGSSMSQSQVSEPLDGAVQDSGVAVGSGDKVDEVSKRLAELRLKSRQLQAQEEQAASEERFRDAALFQEQWLALKDETRIIELELDRLLAESPSNAGIRGRDLGFGEATTEDAEETDRASDPRVIPDQNGSHLAYSEFLPAPEIESDGDEEEEVIQAVRSRRQQELAFTTGRMMGMIDPLNNHDNAEHDSQDDTSKRWGFKPGIRSQNKQAGNRLRTPKRSESVPLDWVAESSMTRLPQIGRDSPLTPSYPLNSVNVQHPPHPQSLSARAAVRGAGSRSRSNSALAGDLGSNAERSILRPQPSGMSRANSWKEAGSNGSGQLKEIGKGSGSGMVVGRLAAARQQARAQAFLHDPRAVSR